MDTYILHFLLPYSIFTNIINDISILAKTIKARKATLEHKTNFEAIQ